MWYLRLLTYNGFVVLVDNHLNSDPTITLDADLWAKVCSSQYNTAPYHEPTQNNNAVHIYTYSFSFLRPKTQWASLACLILTRAFVLTHHI